MGKGDLRSRRGKLYRGTHGKTRAKGKETKETRTPAGTTRRAPGTPRSGAQ